ncbi:hypothetical protein MNBD_ALPHA06-795 [hydrothermal vent metagenome]|uniref:Uncharacterized protein n=1 Tax=hydrothermal vent metagenome TaxID=652676 RepID=A0A3B0SDF2_9ZZZZ
MAVSEIEQIEPQPSRHKLNWRRGVEFFAAGGLSLLLLPLALLFAPDGKEAEVTLVGVASIWLVYVINDPHFMVTYQIFYRDFFAKIKGQGYQRAEQVRYVMAGLVLPALLGLWVAAVLVFSSALMAAGMMQLLFILVGWHYVKQGYGVLSVLSARRGVFYSTLERNLIITHCLTTWVYAWSMPLAERVFFEMDGVTYIAAGFGQMPITVMFVLFILSGIAAIGVLVAKFVKARQWPPITPLAGLFVTLYLWVVWTGLNEAFSYLIPALHSVQYLFFVFLLETGRARSKASQSAAKTKMWQHLLPVIAIALLLGWLGFHFVPNWLDNHISWDENLLGPTIFMAMITGFINIHHFLMDNVIWRKGNPDMKYLAK